MGFSVLDSGGLGEETGAIDEKSRYFWSIFEG